jgi:V8-like Glu-specific endopeptidase
VLACAGETAPGTALARTEAPIIGGSPEAGYPSVALTLTPSGFACTGALIGTRTLLTAAHCVEADITGGSHGGTAYFGANIDAPDEDIRILRLMMHRYYDPANVRDYDIGLMLLARDAPATLAPMPLRLDPLPEDLVGTSVRVVGFGVDDGPAQTGAGVKRSVELVINSMSDVHLGLGDAQKNICQGDSGGPTLLAFDGVETVIAVSSYGTNQCQGGSKVVRSDAYADFLIEVLDAWEGPCRFDGTCVTECPRSPDPDCDPCGLDTFCAPGCPDIDLDCPVRGLLGALCDTDSDCEHRLCVAALDDPRVGYCSQPCDPSLPEGETCPAPVTVCAAAPGGDPVCRYPAPTPSTQGAPCEFSSDCRSGACDPCFAICIEQCGDGLPACAEGFVCKTFPGGAQGCTLPESGCAIGRPGSGPKSAASRGAGPAAALIVLGVFSLAARARRRRV